MKKNLLIVTNLIAIAVVGCVAWYVGYGTQKTSGVNIPFTASDLKTNQTTYAVLDPQSNIKNYTSNDLHLSFSYSANVVSSVTEKNGEVDLVSHLVPAESNEAPADVMVRITKETLTTSFADFVKNDVAQYAASEGVYTQDISVIAGLPAYHYTSNGKDRTFILKGDTVYEITSGYSTEGTTTGQAQNMEFDMSNMLESVKETLVIN